MAKASLSQLDHEFKGVKRERSLPLANMGEGARAPVLREPTKRELELYSDERIRTCGQCKHFDLEAGRQKMIEEKFFERLTLEQDWKLRHLGAKPDELGLCGESNGTMVVSFMAVGCDHFTPRHNLRKL